MSLYVCVLWVRLFIVIHCKTHSWSYITNWIYNTFWEPKHTHTHDHFIFIQLCYKRLPFIESVNREESAEFSHTALNNILLKYVWQICMWSGMCCPALAWRCERLWNSSSREKMPEQTLILLSGYEIRF